MRIAEAKAGLKLLEPAAGQHPHVVVDVLKMLNVKIVTVMGTIGKNKKKRIEPRHMAIPLVMRVKWWRDQSVSFDRGGSFNLDHYMRICQIKIEQYGKL